VHKERVEARVVRVVRTERVVDVRDRAEHEQAEDERDNEVARDKDVQEDGVEDANDRKAPADGMDHVL